TEHLTDAYASQARSFLECAQPSQSVNGGAGHIQRRARAQCLGHHVADTCQLQYRAGGTTGYYAGTFRCRDQQNAAGALLADYLMGNGRAYNRYGYQALFGIDNALLYGADYFCRFAHSYSDLSLVIADHDNRAEAQFLTALDHFGHAANLNDLLFPVALLSRTRVVAAAAVRFARVGAPTFALAFAS